MKEVVVEGLEEKDFVILERILKTYKVSLSDDISFEEIRNLHSKVEQIVSYLED
jgi:hypothetical protein